MYIPWFNEKFKIMIRTDNLTGNEAGGVPPPAFVIDSGKITTVGW
jgi:hypothetical protein